MRLSRLAVLLGMLVSTQVFAVESYQVQKRAAAGFPVEIVPVNEAGQGLPIWAKMGDEFLVATADAIGLRFRNHTNHAVRVVVGMDDINLADGSPWQINGRGFIIPANADIIVADTCDGVGNGLAFSAHSVVAGEGAIRWAVFKEHVTWADPTRDFPLPPTRTVSACQATDPLVEQSFHSQTPYPDQLGQFLYDRPADLQLRGIIPYGYDGHGMPVVSRSLNHR